MICIQVHGDALRPHQHEHGCEERLVGDGSWAGVSGGECGGHHVAAVQIGDDHGYKFSSAARSATKWKGREVYLIVIIIILSNK